MITAVLAALLGAAGAQVGSSGLRLAGSETRSMLFTDCYELKVFDADGRLTEAELTDTGQPLSIEVTVLYDGDLPDMPEGWTDEIVPVLTDGKMQALRAAYGRLAEGDVIRLDYAPGETSVISVNGEAVLSDPGFALTGAMLDVWFGETPVDEDVKEAFLGS